MPKKSAKQPIPDETTAAIMTKAVTDDTGPPNTSDEEEVRQLSGELLVTDEIPSDPGTSTESDAEVPDGNLSDILAQMENEDETATEETRKPDTTSSTDSYIEQYQARKRREADRILTVVSKDEYETEKNREATIWHEIRNAYRTRRILTGKLGGIECLEGGLYVAVVIYKDMRAIIPIKEMIVKKPPGMSRMMFEDYMIQQNKILTSMMGANIDFIVRGIESKSRSIVASRREAMLRKRQLFYLDTDSTGGFRIHENRIVQARITSVTEKTVFMEVFGVDCVMRVSDMTWDWVGDARERYNVGDQILVRIMSVNREKIEDIQIEVDTRSVGNKSQTEYLEKCQIQGKYAGRIVDVHNGMVFIRLSNGANAVAHSCLDRRLPGKHDDVSFVVTHIDEERVYAVGMITRIIKQNL